MKNYVQEGKVIDLTTPAAGYTSGQLVVVNELTGVANLTTAENELCPVSVEGVFELSKGAVAIAVGDKVYSDAGAAVNTTNTDTFVGVAVSAAASGDATVKVRLSN